MSGNTGKPMQALAKQARANGSSAVVVWREGEPVFNWHDGRGFRPIELMSVTKMIVGVVTGVALGGDGIEALSTPLATWFPEWAGDARSTITLRHVLTHTSGLEVLSSADVYAASDIVQLALDRPLVVKPGIAHRYSNSTFNLLAGVVKRATGQRLDEVAGEQLFGPLGFGDWSWQQDLVGNPFCMAGLSARADDIARIGEVLLERGRWQGQQLIPANWVAAMPPKPPADVGLACFTQHEVTRSRVTKKLLDLWIAAGIDPELVSNIQPYADKDGDPEAWRRKLDTHTASRLAAEVLGRGLKLVDQDIGSAVGYGHDGDLGQYLVVMPDDHMAVVRSREEKVYKRLGGSWPTFIAAVRRAVSN